MVSYASLNFDFEKCILKNRNEFHGCKVQLKLNHFTLSEFLFKALIIKKKNINFQAYC